MMSSMAADHAFKLCLHSSTCSGEHRAGRGAVMLTPAAWGSAPGQSDLPLQARSLGLQTSPPA